MKSFKQFLNEKRSNPDKNVKSTFMDDLRSTIAKKGKGEYFVSFTDLNKIGVNPTSKYDTPLGIYFYPVDFVLGFKTTGELPFAGERKYAQVVKAKAGTIVDVSGMTDGEEQEWYKKIDKVFVDYMKQARNYSKLPEGERAVFDREFNGLVPAIVKKASEHAKIKGKAGGRFWYVTMQVATKMVDGQSDLIGSVKEHPKRWNTLFRKLGINACIDNGNGIIHNNERNQAIFFDKSGFEQVDTIMNNLTASPIKFSPDLAKEFFKSNKIWHQRDLFNSFDVDPGETDEKTHAAVMRYWWYALDQSLSLKDWSGFYSKEGTFVSALYQCYEDTPTLIKNRLKDEKVTEWLKTMDVNFEVISDHLGRDFGQVGYKG